MLVLADQLLAVVHGLDLAGEEALSLGARITLLAARGIRILFRAADVLLYADVVGRLAQRDRVVAQIDHPRIDEPPSERRVGEHALAAGKRFRRLQGHERRASHTLDAASDDHVGFPRADPPRGIVHGLEAAAAETVHGDSRHGLG